MTPATPLRRRWTNILCVLVVMLCVFIAIRPRLSVPMAHDFFMETRNQYLISRGPVTQFFLTRPLSFSPWAAAAIAAISLAGRFFLKTTRAGLVLQVALFLAATTLAAA